MGSGRRIWWIALLATGASVCMTPRACFAQTKAPTQNQIDAEQHFQKARALYKAGSYKEAIDELKKAHDLDPTAKDLVLNLSTVNERLGNIDDALDYMRQYEKMDLTPAEHDKTEQAVHRLEGAKKELDAKAEAERQRLLAQQQQQQQNPQPQPESRPHGRIDVLTIGAAAVAVAGFTVGTIFGLKALSDKPPASGFVTGTGGGANGSYQDLQDAASHAHGEAQISDVAFVVGGIATIGTAVLYFARTRDKHPPPSQGTTPAPSEGASNAKPLKTRDESARSHERGVWVAPTIGGVMLGGSF